jgi:hypothetical protein
VRITSTLVTATSAVVALIVPAGASATHSRTVHRSYTAPVGVQGQLAGVVTYNGAIVLGGFDVKTSPRDKFVNVTLADQSGLPVPAELAEDVSGNGNMNTLATFCTHSPGAVRLQHPGANLVVYVLAGTCATTPSAPTTGSGDVTLTR